MSIIKYNPLPPTNEGTALRVGWSPKIISNSIIDVSGNAKHGIQINGCAWEEDQYFGSIIHGFGDKSLWSFPATLSVSGTATFGCWYKIPSLTSIGADNYSGLFCGTTGNDLISIYSNGSGFLRAELQISGVARSLIDSGQQSRANVWTLAIFTYDGDRIRIYVDGVLRQTSASYPSVLNGFSAGTAYFGGFTTFATYGLNGVARSPFILNKCWSQEEITQYYNLSKQACWKTDFGALSTIAAEGGTTGAYLSNTLFQFSDTTGRFYIETDTVNGRSTKVIRCSTAGALYLKLDSINQNDGAGAFGEWDFWFYKVDATNFYIDVVADAAQPTNNGYELWFDAVEKIYLARVTAGALVNTIMVTDPVPTFAHSTWNRMRLSRTVAGVWTMRLNETLTAVGAGANPGTDTTHLTGNYITIRMGIGDKLALGAIDGSNALVKRLKG